VQVSKLAASTGKSILHFSASTYVTHSLKENYAACFPCNNIGRHIRYPLRHCQSLECLAAGLKRFALNSPELAQKEF